MHQNPSTHVCLIIAIALAGEEIVYRDTVLRPSALRLLKQLGMKEEISQESYSGEWEKLDPWCHPEILVSQEEMSQL